MNVHAVHQGTGPLGHRLLPAVLLAGAMSLVPTAASPVLAATAFPYVEPGVQPRPDDAGVYHGGEVIAAAELDTLRGGFNLAGMELNFGAKLTTLINNTIRYETEVAFRNSGGIEVLSQTLSNAGGSPVTLVGPGSTGAATIAGTGGGGGLDLSGLTDFSGIVVEGPGGIGSTAALHRITRQAIVSTLATTASGQTIHNDIDISVQLNNIGELRSAQQKARILNALQGIVR